MHRKKHSVYRIWDYPQFKASSESLGTYLPQIVSHSGVRINMYAARVENHWLLAQALLLTMRKQRHRKTSGLPSNTQGANGRTGTQFLLLVRHSPPSSRHRPLHHARPHEQPAKKPGWPGPGDTAPGQLSVCGHPYTESALSTGQTWHSGRRSA